MLFLILLVVNINSTVKSLKTSIQNIQLTIQLYPLKKKHTFNKLKFHSKKNRFKLIKKMRTFKKNLNDITEFRQYSRIIVWRNEQVCQSNKLIIGKLLLVELPIIMMSTTEI
jgi:uncharacterized membrane protein